MLVRRAVDAFPLHLTGCVLRRLGRRGRHFKKTPLRRSWGRFYARHHIPPLKSRRGGTGIRESLYTPKMRVGVSGGGRRPLNKYRPEQNLCMEHGEV